MSAADEIKKIKDKFGGGSTASAWLAIEELARQLDRVESEAPRRALDEMNRQLP